MDNYVGLLGVIFVLLAYLFLQFEYLRQIDAAFSWLNVLGSICLIYSLWYNWNLSSFTIEVAWFFISLFGVVKSLRKRLARPII